MKIKGPTILGQRRLLTVQPKKTEHFEYEWAVWLNTLNHPNFLPFYFNYDYETGRSALRYDATGLVPLDKALKKRSLSNNDYLYLLTDMAQVVLECSKGGYKSSSLVFDPRHVYMDESGRLQFIFAPLSGIAFDSTNSPLTFLRFASDTRCVKFDMADDAARAGRLADFVQREGVFSYNNYKDFIGREFGVEICADGSLAYINQATEFVRNSSTQMTGGYTGQTGYQDYQAGHQTGYQTGFQTAPQKGYPTPQTGTGFSVGGHKLVRHATGEAFALPASGSVTAGKGMAASIQLTGNGTISREHARITLASTGATIEDLSSTNGTFVRGARLVQGQRAFVAFGENFQLAQETFSITT